MKVYEAMSIYGKAYLKRNVGLQRNGGGRLVSEER